MVRAGAAVRSTDASGGAVRSLRVAESTIGREPRPTGGNRAGVAARRPHHDTDPVLVGYLARIGQLTGSAQVHAVLFELSERFHRISKALPDVEINPVKPFVVRPWRHALTRFSSSLLQQQDTRGGLMSRPPNFCHPFFTAMLATVLESAFRGHRARNPKGREALERVRYLPVQCAH